MLLGLAGEADDHVRRQAHAWDALADLGYQSAVLIHGVASDHALEDGIVARLDRDLNVLADFREAGHSLNDSLLHVGGMRGQEADAPQALDSVDSGQEVGQIGLARQVVAIGVHVLTQQGYLSRPAFHQAFHLFDNLVHRSASLPPSPQPDDAVGAEVIAALNDWNVTGYWVLEFGVWKLEVAC